MLVTRGLIAATMISVLGGCSTTGLTPTATSTRLVEASDFASAAALVAIVEAAPPDAKLIGTIDAYACQAHGFDPIPTDELATAMLQSEAAKRGARFLTHVSLDRKNIDIERNCYWTIHASGVAYS